MRDPETLVDYAKSLDCIHCGLCVSSCPTWELTGVETSSPRGPHPSHALRRRGTPRARRGLRGRDGLLLAVPPLRERVPRRRALRRDDGAHAWRARRARAAFAAHAAVALARVPGALAEPTQAAPLRRARALRASHPSRPARRAAATPPRHRPKRGAAHPGNGRAPSAAGAHRRRRARRAPRGLRDADSVRAGEPRDGRCAHRARPRGPRPALPGLLRLAPRAQRRPRGGPPPRPRDRRGLRECPRVPSSRTAPAAAAT